MKTLIIAAVALFAAVSSTNANTFINGDFSQNTGPGQIPSPSGAINNTTTLTGWYTPQHGYSFLFEDGTLDTTGATGEYGRLTLWGSHDGGADVIPASPTGAWDVAIDGDFQTSPLSQDIAGLHVGKTYTVGFNYAYAQQTGYYGDTKQSVTVNLGSDNSTAQTTPTGTNPSQDFTGWYTTHFNFVATSTAETLTFLANGDKPIPPFAVISGVTFTPDAVPEPATWAMMLIGLAGMGLMARRRRSISLTA